MGTRTLCLLFFAASLLLAAASCSDDLAPAAESQGKTPIDVANLQGEELEKYAYGCEYYAEDTTEKVETSAGEAYSAYVAELVSAMTDDAFMRKKSLSVDEPLVGVIKVKECGRYPEIAIYYDAEDKRPRCWRNGYANSCGWDVGRNVTMRFCAVPARLFNGIGKDYAVLLLHSQLKGPLRKSQGTYDYLNVVRIFMDAEDGKPEQRITITDYDKFSGRYRARTGNNSDIRPAGYVGKSNLELYFQHFPASWKGATLPNLGFEYAVFGSLYGFNDKYEGYIYVDDEDKNNSNAFELIQVKYSGGSFDKFVGVSGESWRHRDMFENMFKVDNNTLFRISKAPSWWY